MPSGQIVLNQIADAAFSADAAGRAKFTAGFVTATELGSGAVTAGKLADGSIDTAARFAAGVVNTAAISANAVTSAKVDGTVLSTAAPGAGAQWDAGSRKIANLAAPTTANDAVRKTDLDSVSAGISWKQSCRLATAAALPAHTRSGNTLTASANGALSVDGTAVAVGDRILVKDEAASHLEHGLYTVTATGGGAAAWVLDRAGDADVDAEVKAGISTFIAEGTANADTGWTLVTNDPITLNTTALQFTQFTGVGQIIAGAGLTKTTPNQLDVGAGSGILANADNIAADYETVTAPTTTDAATASALGSDAQLPRSDHRHGLTTAAPTVTVKSEATAAAVGTAAGVLRADAQIQAATAAPSVAAKSEATAAGQGTSSSLLRADAQIQVATAAPTVTIKSEATAAGQGASSSMLRADAQLQAATAAAAALTAQSANGQGSSSSLARADHTHDMSELLARFEEVGYDSIDAQGFIAGTGTEGKVNAGTGNTVDIAAAGTAYGADGKRYAFTAPTGLAITPPGTGSDYRIVYVNTSGVVATSNATPRATAVLALADLPANAILLGLVKANAGQASQAAGDIKDHRRRAGRTPEQESRTTSTATTFEMARRIQNAKVKGVKVYRNGLRLKYVASPATVNEYSVSNGDETNGSTVTFGAAPASADEHLFDYWY